MVSKAGLLILCFSILVIMISTKGEARDLSWTIHDVNYGTKICIEGVAGESSDCFIFPFPFPPFTPTPKSPGTPSTPTTPSPSTPSTPTTPSPDTPTTPAAPSPTSDEPSAPSPMSYNS